jgi:hypothetical protein
MLESYLIKLSMLGNEDKFREDECQKSFKGKVAFDSLIFCHIM